MLQNIFEDDEVGMRKSLKVTRKVKARKPDVLPLEGTSVVFDHRRHNINAEISSMALVNQFGKLPITAADIDDVVNVVGFQEG